MRVEAAALRARLGGREVLGGVDLKAEPGEWLGLIGSNGAGKSTLLRVLAGLVGYQGALRFDEQDARSLGPRRRARLIAFAPQVPVMPDGVTVRDYVLLGRTPYHSLLRAPSSADREAAQVAVAQLDAVELSDRLLSTLSGGERQRVVLARALAQQPRLLLLDEPTAALDLGHAQQVLETVDELRREHQLTVISSLHDLQLAGQYADRLLLLADGTVVREGAADQVLTPATLAEHYGALAEVTAGPTGVRVHPVRR